MDTRTGKIYEVSDDATKNDLKGLTELTNKEHQKMLSIPESIRPLELALLRFTEERKRLKAPMTVSIRNAFRIGFAAGVASQRDEK